MWVVTFGVNQYDQEGEYLLCCFNNKPVFEELKALNQIGSDSDINHLLTGGGRQRCEDVWFYLTELKSGILYEHHDI